MLKYGRAIRVSLVAAACMAAVLAACDDDDNDYDYTPPAGQGTLVVENNTDNHLAVYVDGVSQARADEDKSTPYDLAPGDYRVALDEEGGDRREAVTVDVLEGRLTILDVQEDFADDRDLDVFVSYD
jgi:hypothetical protein